MDAFTPAPKSAVEVVVAAAGDAPKDARDGRSSGVGGHAWAPVGSYQPAGVIGLPLPGAPGMVVVRGVRGRLYSHPKACRGGRPGGLLVTP